MAVPRLTPALRQVLSDRQVDPRQGTAVKKDYQKTAANPAAPMLPEAVSVVMAELAGDVQEGLLAMAVGTDSFGGDMRVERGAQCWQVQMAVDAAKLAAGFDHPGRAPAQCHGAALPVLHVARVGAGDGDHRRDRYLELR